VRAALTWATDARDVDLAVRLLSLWDMPYIRSERSTARWACETVLAIPGVFQHPRYPAVLAIAAFLAWQQGEQDVALRRCDEALDAEQRLGAEPSRLVRIAQVNVALAQGHAADAVEYGRQAVELSRRSGEPARLANALAVSAMAHTMSGDSTAALADAEEIIVLAHQLANTRVVQIPLGAAAFVLGDSEPERALALALEVAALTEPGDHTTVWGVAGDLAARSGEVRDALVYFDKGIDAVHWLGSRPMIGTQVERVGSLLADRDPETTAVLQGVGEALAPGYSHSPYHVEAHAQATRIVDASLSAERLQALRARGMSMTDAEAVDYAKAAIARYLGEEVL
jgi:tetratricopeptide (TPR) repeat protein